MLCLNNFLFRGRRRLLFVFWLFVLGRLLLAGLLGWSLRPLLARRALRTYQAKESKPCAPRDAIHDGFILQQLIFASRNRMRASSHGQSEAACAMALRPQQRFEGLSIPVSLNPGVT